MKNILVLCLLIPLVSFAADEPVDVVTVTPVDQSCYIDERLIEMLGSIPGAAEVTTYPTCKAKIGNFLLLCGVSALYQYWCKIGVEPDIENPLPECKPSVCSLCANNEVLP